jgi:hypothetical protein
MLVISRVEAASLKKLRKRKKSKGERERKKQG